MSVGPVKQLSQSKVMPAPRKWIPAAATIDDRIEAGVFKGTYANPDLSGDRVRSDFKAFEALNPGLTPEVLGYTWVGQMRRCKMSAGTIETYANMIGGCMAGEVRRAIEKQHADATTKHAVDLSDTELVVLVTDAPKVLQPTMWVMLTTGCHAKDAARLRRLQVTCGAQDLKVAWHWTKSIAHRKDRNTVSYPLVCPPPKSFLDSHAGAPDGRPFTSTAAQINMHLDGRTTSLVFRRAVEQRWRLWATRSSSGPSC